MSKKSKKANPPEEGEDEKGPLPSSPKKKTRAKLVVKEVKVEATGRTIVPEPRAAKIVAEPEPDGQASGEQSDEPVTRLEQPAVAKRSEEKRPEEKPGEKPETADFEKIEEDAGSEDGVEEASQQPVAVGWWVLIAGGVLVLIVIGAVALSSYKDGLAMQQVDGPEISLAAEDPFEGSPEQWFHQRAGEVGEQALALMASYLEAGDDDARSRYVRNPGLYLERAPNWPVKVRPRLESVDENQWAIDHTEQTAFLTLDTEDQDFLPTRIYFVRQGEGLKLDWMASTAWSERSLADLKKAMVEREKQMADLRRKAAAVSGPGDPLPSGQRPGMELPAPVLDKPVLLRCLLRRKNEFYAGPYNDKDHAAFMILSPDKSEYLWAYVNRGSKLDIELRKLLDHGSFVVDLKKNVRVTVRVKAGKKDALPSQLELMELVHPEWVRP